MPDGVRTPSSNKDQAIAFAILTETGGASDDSSPVYDAAGKFVGWDTNYRDGTSFHHGFAGRTEVDAGGDKGVIGWARLVGGTKALGFARGPESGDHFVWGVPATNLPTTGSALYELIGVTRPTMRDDSVAAGTFTGRLAISFVTSRMGLDASVAIGGATIPIVSTGGVEAPSLNIASGQFNLTSGGPACITSGCRFVYRGFLAGPKGSHYGLAYTIRDNAANTFKFVDGVAVFGNPGAPPQAAGGKYDTAYRGVTLSTGFTQPETRFALIGNLNTVREVGPLTADDGGIRNPGTTVRSGGQDTPELTAVGLVGGGERALGTAKNTEFGGLGGTIGWTRWTGGTVDNSNRPDRTLTGSQSIHMLFGSNPTGALPTGKASYILAGGTSPTRADGIGGAGTAKGELVIDFATSKVGWDMLIAIADDKFNFLSAGGLAAPSGNLVTSSGATTFGGEGTVYSEKGRCGGCVGTASGFLSGPSGRYAGMAYTLGTFDYGNVHGVAVFDKGP